MPNRSADVFFYGLFMDQELVHSRGITPERVEVAWVDGLERSRLLPPSAIRNTGISSVRSRAR